MLNRYNRQQLIKGWDQKNLKESSIAIIGSYLLAQYTVIPLVALGVGDIRIIGNEKTTGTSFLDRILNGYVAPALEEVLTNVNPDCNIIGLRSILANESSLYFLKDVDLVIDTTNDPASKAIVSEYCRKKDIEFFSMSCNENFGRLIKNNGKKDIKILMPDLEYQEQSDLISLVLGGLVTEEIKKILMKDKNQLDRALYYNLGNGNRFSYEKSDNHAKTEDSEFLRNSALLIGAGALGNFVGLGLAKLGVGRIDIMDPDVIEETNLNRQILFYDSIGQNKAEMLAKKLKKVSCGRTRTNAYVERFDKNTKLKIKYNLIFDCVDNFETRANLSDFAVNLKIPLISGATSYEAGQAAIYVPEKTSSIDYKLKLHDAAKKTKEAQQRRGCIYAPNPSVIMTNQIIGGFMVAESRTVFNPEKYGEPLNGILKYGSNLENRLGITPIAKVVEQ